MIQVWIFLIVIASLLSEVHSNIVPDSLLGTLIAKAIQNVIASKELDRNYGKIPVQSVKNSEEQASLFSNSLLYFII